MATIQQAKAAYSEALGLLTNASVSFNPNKKFAEEMQATSSVMAYYGFVIQGMSTSFTEHVPTAGICWDEKNKRYQLLIGPTFFCSLKPLERVAILIHELSHVTSKHVLYKSIRGEEKQLVNVAMDMVINQTIKHLPEGCIDRLNFKDSTGVIFPPDKTTEVYMALLKQDGATMKTKSKDENGNETEEWKPIPKQLKNDDSHDWDVGEIDPNTKEGREKLEAIRDMLKRGKQKQEMAGGFSTLPESIRDFLTELDNLISKLSAKEILKQSLRQSIPSKKSKSTWKRPSRRWGMEAKGSTADKLPSVAIYSDQSGSISTQEQNEQLDVLRKFFSAGVKDMRVYFFHTRIFKEKKITKTFKFVDEELESGGTDLQCVVDQIKKRPADINIVMTDGCYGDVSCDKLPQTIFIISKSGHVEHPLKRLGKTVHYV